jgi:hypothetical protein
MPPDSGVAPLKAGAWLVAVESGTAVVLLGFSTLGSKVSPGNLVRQEIEERCALVDDMEDALCG